MKGALVNTRTGAEQQYTALHATTIPLHASIVIPDKGYVGLVICERYAGRHLRHVLETAILGSALEAFPDHRADLSVYADRESWEAFLNQASIYRVTSVFRERHLEDFGDQRRRPVDLKMMAAGPLAARIGRAVMDRLRESLHNADQSYGISIDEVPELHPANRQHYKRERLEIQVGDERDKRTIVVEREQLPQFVYMFDIDGRRRVSEAKLKSTWAAEAERILGPIRP